MATLAIRKGIWIALSQRNRTAVQMMDVLALGDGVEYDDGVDQWMIFDDPRWTQDHIAYLACLLSNVGQLRASYAIPMNGTEIDRPQLKADIRDFCNTLPSPDTVTEPASIPHVENANRWQELIDAQGGNHSQMTSGVQVGWTPVEIVVP